jgi:hypothetical protein
MTGAFLLLGRTRLVLDYFEFVRASRRKDGNIPFAVPALKDVAAMGRVWHLEAAACRRMKARERLIESARKVCRAAKGEGCW